MALCCSFIRRKKNQKQKITWFSLAIIAANQLNFPEKYCFEAREEKKIVEK